MDGSRIESRCERDFPCLFRPATGFIQSFAKGGKAVFLEGDVDHLQPPSSEVTNGFEITPPHSLIACIGNACGDFHPDW